jgi:hypothetical protein
MKKLLLATAMLFLFTSEGYAYGVLGDSVLGEGKAGCFSHLKIYENRLVKPQLFEAYRIHTGWVRGFISGHNFAKEESVALSSDKEAIEVWILNYCKANPLDTLAAAAAALILELDNGGSLFKAQ